MVDGAVVSGAGVIGAAGAGLEGAGVVVDGAAGLGGVEVSSLSPHAVSATAITEARIKVLLIIMRLLSIDDDAAPNRGTENPIRGNQYSGYRNQTAWGV